MQETGLKGIVSTVSPSNTEMIGGRNMAAYVTKCNSSSLGEHPGN